MTTTLQIRIDEKIKARAQRALKGMGLDMSSGVKLFLTQVGNTGEIPFRILSADNLSESKKQKLVAEAEVALKSGKSYRSAKEAHEDILRM
jgi:DNA-damage-inducible protein J